MRLPLQITFRHMDPSPALEGRIRELAERLEKFSDQIALCHVVVEGPHGHQRQGERFSITMDITVPGREITVRRARPDDPSHEDAYVALRDVFRAARRRLQDYQRRRRHDVKTHVEMARGRVAELHPEQDFGRIETPDGRMVYFHAHSVLDLPFMQLTMGTQVRFTEEQGEQGPQASTVHVLRPGASS
jgi:cold shock CspA family protein/ribosome-associated translation inhibitor RaiA